MDALHYPSTVNINQQHYTYTQSPKVRYAPAPPTYVANAHSRSAKGAEYPSEKPSIQVRSQNKLRGTLVGYDFLEPPKHKRPSDLEIPPKPSSDILSPLIPTSPLPEYSSPPQYSPLRPSKEHSKEAIPESQRRTSTRPPSRASHAASPPPKYHKEDVVDFSDFYSGAKTRSAGRTLPRPNPIKNFDTDPIYSFIGDYTVDLTPPKPGRLALAASRESRSSKKEFETYKRRARNHARSFTEELDKDSEVDDLANSILGDIAAIRRSRGPEARATFDHAFVRA
ncbi:hypothetical protein RSOLAG22IIIB_12436 [Rhizoctonia solani]|uniref:Uncharacterized protein n=1 Tax=Rhizoctonia solani TaxID=456999 RepID=A0A0K6GDU1_9AGAM|nr:hypothetical protein RSOLAG22IIIB_12436 [Rhizoctonia solani]